MYILIIFCVILCIMTEINDIRLEGEFKNVTFSNYKKKNVNTELLNNIFKSKIEESCYWSAELICSGHFLDLWNIIIKSYCTYIHLGNPKLIIFIKRKLEYFVNYVKMYQENIIKLRNNDSIRKMFCEIISILCYSVKKPSINVPKIEVNDMNITNITDKFIAPNTDFVNKYIEDDDPNELFIPLNELVYNLKNNNIMNSFYWIKWVLCYHSICKKNKKKLLCSTRYSTKIDSSFQKHVIWLIWKILLDVIKEKNCKVLEEISSCALYLFQVKFTEGVCNQRIGLLYYMIQIICEENPQITKPILNATELEKIKVITNKIDNIYTQLKKNEIAPKTDYLFINENTNLDKSKLKIDAINSFENLN